jgi:hypothetical protein
VKRREELDKNRNGKTFSCPSSLPSLLPLFSLCSVLTVSVLVRKRLRLRHSCYEVNNKKLKRNKRKFYPLALPQESFQAKRITTAAVRTIRRLLLPPEGRGQSWQRLWLDEEPLPLRDHRHPQWFKERDERGEGDDIA